MKKKWVYSIVLLFIFIIGLFVYAVKKTQNRLSLEKEYIEQNVFEKDSTGRGYSDILYNRIQELKKETNNDLSIQWLEKHNIYVRKKMLSKTKKEYEENADIADKNYYCFLEYSEFLNKNFNKWHNEIREHYLYDSNDFKLMLLLKESQMNDFQSSYNRLNRKYSKEECKGE